MTTRLYAYKIVVWTPHSPGSDLGYQEGRSRNDAIERYRRRTGDTQAVFAERIKIDGFKINLEKIASSKR